EGIAEAEIVAWHVAVGDMVKEDQPLADMMTDKATVEMESPVAGTVVRLAGAAGDMVAIGAALIEIETEESVVSSAPSATEPVQLTPVVTHNPTPEALATPDTLTLKPAENVTPKPAKLSQTAAAPPLASPAVRVRAKELGVDLAAITPGAGGRIRHADLDAYLGYHGHQGFGTAMPARPDKTIKVIGMRRKIAENMAASKRHIPHFAYVEEIDVTALEAIRADLNATRGTRPKLTLLPLLITAICKVLPDFPMLNARYDDEAGLVTRHGAVHMGMATQTDAGLMVPVIRDAQTRNIWQLAGEIMRLAEAARTGSIRPEEMGGGTITITSLGPLGGIATTPIINRPEVAIIGPNRIIERPIYDGDTIRRAKLMNLSLSCDHRVVDGWEAASFVQAVRRLLETPVLLFAPS
ncbi:MAG: 2-oxo acid dehydrogenase subunit E2, partial [Alphaproteobacteria bacterium]|nr:2-oxo acid dehydrogenase subunit E2 [Alphaproteobacteria bacterium]